MLAAFSLEEEEEEGLVFSLLFLNEWDLGMKGREGREEKVGVADFRWIDGWMKGILFCLSVFILATYLMLAISSKVK